MKSPKEIVDALKSVLQTSSEQVVETPVEEVVELAEEKVEQAEEVIEEAPVEEENKSE